MLCTGGGEIGTRFVQAAFQLLALSIQPFQREGGFVSSAERFAEHLIGAGERGSACRQLFTRLLGRFPGSGKTGICRFDLCGGLGAEVFDGFQAIEANQAFGRRRAAFGSDIAVPAAKFPPKRDNLLATGGRLPFVFLRDRKRVVWGKGGAER